MPTTSNFGWTTPADTDLVKNGALAIRTLGNGIDTSLLDLKGGTTGQILAKASNTDLDYTWINNDQGDITAVTAGTGISGGGTSGAVTITNSMATEITASGDIIVGTGSGTFDNLPIGTTGQVLTADTTVSPYKVKWATPAAGASFVGCSMYKSGNQSVANATTTAITFDTEDFDTDGFHSTSTNTDRITIPTGKGGKYLFTWCIGFAANATGIRAMPVSVNGTNYNFFTMNNAGATYNLRQTGCVVLNLVAGDYVALQAYQESGGNLDVVGGVQNTRFACVYLGA